MHEWRCGGSRDPDAPPCSATWPETGDGSGYAAARDHAKATRHIIAGCFDDSGALIIKGLEGAKLTAMTLGIIDKPGEPRRPAQRTWPKPVTPPAAPSGGAEPEPEQEPEDDDGEPFDDEEDEEGEEGEGGEGAEPSTGPSPVVPRGRRPALGGAYRAWVPYPALTLNEGIGLYFRCWAKVMVPMALDGNGEETEEFDFTQPVGIVMADYIMACVQAHQRNHPEQYDMGSVLEEPRHRALDERERALAERERRVRETHRKVLEYAQSLLQSQDLGMPAAAAGGGR